MSDDDDLDAKGLWDEGPGSNPQGCAVLIVLALIVLGAIKLIATTGEAILGL